MKRVTVDMAAQATGLFDVHRFRQHTKKERESAWHAFRALGVGGSDMSTILGLNPYSTPYELWLEKTNRQQPEDISGKWAIVKGNALEVELRRRFRQLHPEYQVIDGTDISLVSKQHPLMHASLDGFVYDEASDSWGILEIKTANANRGRTDWHDETGEPAASCNVNASAVAITNVRQKVGGQSQGYGAQGGYTQQTQGGYQQSQPPASDPWANGGSDPEF